LIALGQQAGAIGCYSAKFDLLAYRETKSDFARKQTLFLVSSDFELPTHILTALMEVHWNPRRVIVRWDCPLVHTDRCGENLIVSISLAPAQTFWLFVNASVSLTEIALAQKSVSAAIERDTQGGIW